MDVHRFMNQEIMLFRFLCFIEEETPWNPGQGSEETSSGRSDQERMPLHAYEATLLFAMGLHANTKEKGNVEDGRNRPGRDSSRRASLSGETMVRPLYSFLCLDTFTDLSAEPAAVQR